MAVFNVETITAKGLALIAKGQLGVEINFTRMQIGRGQLSGQDPEQLAALIDPIAYFGINSMARNGVTVQVRGIYENSALTAPVHACELGVFAMDPDDGEILYAYSNAGTQGDNIPAYASGPYSKMYKLNVAIGNAEDVTVEVPAGAYIPEADKGVAGGVAPLNSGGVVPVVNLPNATLSAKGVSQLNSATDSTAEDRAATPKAVKVAVDAAAAAQATANAAQTKANAALPASSYTAADILAKLKTVDGAGSGLDADLVDGLHAATFAQARGAIGDANDAVNDGGYLILNTALNAPFSDGWGTMLVSRGGTGAILQMAVFNDGSKVAIRHFNGTSWGLWKKIWTEDSLRINAGQLEFLDGGVWKSMAAVKSIQKGISSVNSGSALDLTISAVNVNKTTLSMAGEANAAAQLELTSATTLRLRTSLTGLIPWQVVEYY